MDVLEEPRQKDNPKGDDDTPRVELDVVQANAKAMTQMDFNIARTNPQTIIKKMIGNS